MRLSQFRVHTAAFEVRFDPAYLLFDTSGEVWQGVKTAYPSLKVVQAAPSKVVGILDGRYQLSVELERVVIEDFPASWDLGTYITVCGSILPNVLAHLRVSLFTRIGLRLVYRQGYPTKKECSTALLSLGLMKGPTGKHFGIEGHSTSPHYAIRWEGKTLGVTVNVRAQERRILVEPPLGEPVFDRVDKEVFDLDYDIDYYTMTAVSVGQFRAKDWIQQAVHVIERDSHVFLGGASA